MKKTILLFSIPIGIIIFSVCGLLITQNTTNRLIKQENEYYEYYFEKEIYGTDVISIINKAINENEQNGIQKNEKGHYIENEENSIKLEIKMLITNKTYPMEEIYKNDITKFVENFNFIKFKCINIEYHKNTGRISKITFEELE